jgi:hypothetical protein
MTKLHILREIKRTTQANGGTPLRKLQFESETGIKRYDWFGVYWARWSDAVREAGYMQDNILEITQPRHSKPLRYEATRAVPMTRLA